MERLQMNIRGIEHLEDVEAWEDATRNYIMTYFNATNSDPRVFDVLVNIKVTKQTSSNAELFNRRLSWLGNGQQWSEGRQLQSKNVQVMYDQTATYKATNPTEDPKDDAQYIAVTPFSSRRGAFQYSATLKRLSPYYNLVTSIGSVMVDPPPPGTPIDERIIGGARRPPPEKKGISNLQIAIIVSLSAGGILVAAIIVIVWRWRRKKRRRLEGTRAGSVPPDTVTYVDLEEGTIGSVRDAALVGHRQNQLGAQGRTDSRFDPDALLSDDDEGGHDVTIHVIAPPGKLGVIVDTPFEGGPPFVCEIKETSPLRGEIQLDDKIVAVDDEDMQRMSSINVSKILARKSRQPERKITVVRRVSEGTWHDMDFDVDGTAMTMLYDAYNNDEVIEVSTAVFAPKKERKLDLVCPSGKLGIVLVTPEPPALPGPAYVFNIRKDSPLDGKVMLGDKIVTVDDQDVRSMTAIDVSKLLGSKSNNPSRKITVLREVDDDDNESPPGRVASPPVFT